MKKILWCLVVATMSLCLGCTKDEATDKSTYTFVCNADISQWTTFDVFFVECDASGSHVNTIKLSKPERGKSYKYTAGEHCEKIKVQLHYIYGSTNKWKWIQQTFYLVKGSDISITLNDNTLIGNSEP